MKKKFLLMMMLSLLFTAMGGGYLYSQELLVNCDYNSSTEGYGITKFSNYAGAYAYATANAKKATIVIEKTNTLSGNTFDNNHKNYSQLAVVIKDGATMGNALSKWDMTYPVTVEPGGTLTCARPASSSVSNIHIKNTLTVGAKGATKKAVVDFLSDTYQDCDISIRYNGKILVYNADFKVQDLDAQGTLTIEDSKVEVDGAFASATFYATTLTNTEMVVNGNQISGGLSDFAGGDSNQLGKVTLNNSTITITEGTTKVAATVTANGSEINVNDLTINSGKKVNLNGGSVLDVETLNIVGTGSVVPDETSTIENNGQIIVAMIGQNVYTSLADALSAASAMTGDVTVEIYEKVTLNQPLAGSYSSIKFLAKDTDAEIYLDVEGYITATGKKVAFEDLTLSKSEGGFITNAGFMNVAFGVYDVTEVTYTNCVFDNGACASSGKVTYTGCTFKRSHDKYGLWAYGNVDVTVNGCTFADYRGIKMYAEGAAKTVDLTVENTDFSAVTDKPAIVLTYGEKVTLQGNTYSSTGTFELDLDGAPNGTTVTSDVDPICINDNGACGVLVNDKIYTTVAQAAEVATSGSTVTLLHNSTETVVLPMGVILDKNEYEAAGVTVAEPIAKIGEEGYTSLQAAIDAVQNGETIQLLAGEISEGTIKLPATLNNVTIKGAEGAELKDMTISAADGNSVNYDGLTFDGITFYNSNVVLTGWRTNGVVYKNITVKGCTFKNIFRTINEAAFHINCDAKEAVNGFTFTNNIIDGVSGASNSGIYAQVTGEVKVENNIINNVSFRPYVIQVTTDDGIADNFTVTGNTFSGSIAGRAQGLGNNAEGTDAVSLTISNNIFKDIENAQQICYWNFNEAKTTAVLEKNYYDIDIVANPGMIYFNNAAADKYELSEMGVFPIYRELNEDGTINTASAYTPELPIAQIGEIGYETLAAAAEAAQAGETITLCTNVTENVTLPAGITLNGNGKQINGSIVAGGDLTIKGHTKATSFNAGYNQPIITIGEGACLEMNGTGRMVIGHGATFNITGSIANDAAKTANVADLTPSLVMPGASFTGAGVTFNVTNAYISAPSSYCSSSSSASGTFDFNITNSIWESAGKLAFESQSTAATVNFELKDSKLTTGSHLVFGVSRGEVVIDNSNVNVDTSRQIENRSTMTIKNGSVVNGAVAKSSNAINPGTIIVENATYAVTGEFSGAAEGTGTLIIKKGANVSVGSIEAGANVVVDAEGMAAGDEINFTADLSKFTGTLSVINNDNLEAEIVGGKIVLVVKPVAKIGDVEYTSLEAAVNAAQDGEEIDLLKDVALTSTLLLTKNNILDGNGFKLTPAEGFDPDGNEAVIALAANMSGYEANRTYTVKNLTIEGFSTPSRIVRANFCDATIQNCIFNNNTSASIITSAYAVLNVENNIFTYNTATGSGYGVIDVGSDVSDGTNLVAEITGNKFYNNEVATAGIFLASSADVTDNHFKGNTHTGANANAAAILAGPYAGNMAYTVNIIRNAFENAMSKGGTALPSVFAEDWSSLGSTTSFDLSLNYWDGNEPVAGTAYKTSGDNPQVTVKSYYTTYTDGTLGGLVEYPQGNNFNGYTRTDAIWGEVWGNAKVSFVVKVLDANDNVMGTTSLNNIGGIIDGDVNVTWTLKLDAASNTDKYWTMEWTTAPTINNMPAKVELWVDGVKVSGGPVVLNAPPDNLNKIYAAVTDNTGKILAYHTNVQEAIKAAAAVTGGARTTTAGTVEFLADVTVDKWIMFSETLSIGNGQIITIEKIEGLTIDGNNHKLTINSIESAGNGNRLFYDATNLNIKDLTINYGEGVAGGIGLKSGTISNVNFNGGVSAIYPGAGEVIITDCTFKTSGHCIYFEEERDNLVVTNNTFELPADANVILLRGDVTFTGNNVKSGRTVNVVSGSPVVTGNNFNDVRFKVYNAASATISENTINNLVFNETDVPTESTFTDNILSPDAQAAIDALPAIAGEGTEANPYLINDVDDLVWLQEKVDELAQDGSTQFAGKYFKLTNDIDLNGINWNPIGTMSGDHGSFKGVFDGGDHTIFNLHVEQAGNGIGLFARTTGNAVIKNLKLNNVTVKSTDNSNYVGGLVGNAYASTKIENVHVSGNVYISGRGYIGGIAGHGYVVMDNVSVVATGDGHGNTKGLITSTFWCAGGVLGYAGEGATNIMNAHVENVVVTSAAGGLGAIVGMAEDNNGTQPISGSNLSAENVEIKTYIGAYGDSYANYALGYLYGGNPTSILTGDLSVEEVKIETSTGEAPEVNDAVAKIGNSIYFNLQAALNAAVENETITLLRDIKIAKRTEINNRTLTIDGNGKTIRQDEDFDDNDNNTIALFDINGGKVTIKNVTFDGVKKYAVVRTVGTEFAMDNVTAQNCEHTVDQGLFRLLGQNTITNSKFLNNNCSMVITLNYDDDGESNTPQLVENCLFEGNECNSVAALYYVEGASCTIKNSEFVENTVNCNNNGATVYLGFTENNVVTGNIFQENNVVDASSSTRVAGAIFFGYEAEIENNVFVGNTASNANNDVLGQICTSTYYDCTIDLSGNYWGGEAPEYGEDYTVQHTAAEHQGVFQLDNYYKTFTTDENGNVVLGDIVNMNYVAQVGKFSYETLADAFAAAENETITLLIDTELSEMITIPNGKTVTLDLNGKTITGTDTTSKNFSIIDNRGNLTITDSSDPSTGKITLTATTNSGWSRYSAVIANNPGGKLIIENGTLEHLGGTDMAYGIDNLTNGKGTYAETVINGGTIKSTYRGIRQFLNGTEAQNILTVNGGTIEGANKSIWMQDPSDKANTGTLTVGENAKLKGDVYLYVTPNSTSWPVEVSIAAGALQGESTVMTANLPVGVDVQNINGTYGVVNVVAQIGDVKYQSLAAAVSAAQDADRIELLWAEGNDPISMAASLYGKNVTITGDATVDWSKGWFFVGRGGEGDATLIFDGAILTSASDNASTGIHVSGREKNTNNKYDGTLVIKNSTIELDYLINRGTIELDKGNLTVKNGFGIAGRPASETESGDDATATITLNNESKVVVNNHNGMGVGQAAEVLEGYGIMNIYATSTFETTQSFKISAKGTMNVDGGNVKVDGTLANNGTVNINDATVEIAKLDNDNLLFISGTNTLQVEDASGSSFALRARDGVVFNNSYVKGTANETMRLLGSATFNGGFECAYLQGKSADESNPDNNGVGGTITIEEGTTVHATYGVEFSNNYVLNGGTIELSGGNANGGIWGCVFQDGEYTINSNVIVNGGGKTAPIHFTDATAVVNGNITHSNSGGEVIYLTNSEVTFAETSTVSSTAGVHVNAGATLTNNGVIDANVTVNAGATLYSNNNIVRLITKADDETAVIILTGGTYKQDVNDWCHEYYDAIPNGDGTWTVEQVMYALVRDLQEGWSWFSSFINIDGEAGLTKIKDALGENGVQVKDAYSGLFIQYTSASGWNGLLNEASSQAVYSIKTINDGDDIPEISVKDFTIKGAKVDPSLPENTVYINKGWNYIAYPLDQVAGLDVLSFTPAEGDVIKSKESSSMYWGGGWISNIDMTPGEGYMYKSNDNATKSFNFAYPTRSAVDASISNNVTNDYYWSVNAHKYPSNMTIVAMLNIDNELVKDSYEIAAFANGECRGRAQSVYVESLDTYVLVLTVHGEDVENITFKYYDVNSGAEYELSNIMVYSNDAIVGSVDEPYMFNLDILNVDEASINEVNVYPNPTTTNAEIDLNATCDKVEVFNALGVKVAEYSNVDSIDALETAGVYVIRVTIDGNVRNCRLVVK